MVGGNKAAVEIASPPPRAAERILRSARELFYRHGIRAVGVDEIVANAGVTKPSLYRTYASKDELAASYLRLYETEFWARFDAAIDRHPGDPKAQIMGYLEDLAGRVVAPSYRGCGLTNAAVEYPEPDHPARLVLVLEGALVSSQIFHTGSPSASVAKAAALLIDAATRG
jgi:AcrR family transcriptional regulator